MAIIGISNLDLCHEENCCNDFNVSFTRMRGIRKLGNRFDFFFSTTAAVAPFFSASFTNQWPSNESPLIAQKISCGFRVRVSIDIPRVGLSNDSDETGEFIRADYTLLILAKEFLNREPGQGIVYNVICSKIVREKVAEWGGKPYALKWGTLMLVRKWERKMVLWVVNFLHITLFEIMPLPIQVPLLG